MIRFVLSYTIVLTSLIAHSQTERDSVMIPIQDYMIGTSYNHVEQIVRAFHDSTKLFLDRGTEPLLLSAREYADLFKRRTPGEFNGRYASLMKLDVFQNIAYAEVEIKIPSINSRFIDLMLLKKMPNGWKIIGKTATRYDIPPPSSKPTKTTIMTGLRQPWSMAFIDAHTAIVSELAGDLNLVDLKSKTKKALTGFPSDLFQPIIQCRNP